MPDATRQSPPVSSPATRAPSSAPSDEIRKLNDELRTVKWTTGLTF